MWPDDFEGRMRRLECFHPLRVPDGAWVVLRLDGRGFTRFTEERCEKPFDENFHTWMVATTPGNLTLVGGDYNIAMQNKPFAAKKPVLAASKVYLNREFADPGLAAWTADTIRERGLRIARAAATVWAGPPVAPA